MKNKIELGALLTCVVLVLSICTWTILKINSIVFAVNSEAEIPASIKNHSVVLKAGQIWGSESEGEYHDPFDKNRLKKIRKRVLAVKDGYVKYCFVGQEDYGEQYSSSERASSFVRFYKLISDGNTAAEK